MSNEIIEVMFEEHYSNFKKYLNKHFRSLNEYDVEDIIQQTVIKLLCKSDDITGISNLTSYMYSSLSNGAKDYFKKQSRVEIHEMNSSHFMEQQTVTTEELVLLKELKMLIKKTLKKMDPKLRRVFIETEVQGRSYKDIMKETNEKLGTLLSRKNRAKRKLQTVVKSYLEHKY